MKDREKDYKRYTNRNYYDSIPLSLKPIRLLQELENKIEDKVLVELPCPIGAPIWSIFFDKDDPCAWCDKDHSGFGDTICELDYSEYPTPEEWLNGEKICPQFSLHIAELKFKWSHMEDLEWLGITWFTNEEEAKEALKKLNEKWNNEKRKSNS